MRARVPLLVLMLSAALVPVTVTAQVLGDTLQSPVEDPRPTAYSANLVTPTTNLSPVPLVRAVPVGLTRTAEDTPQDTVRRRPRAVVYSDGYAVRLKIHRTLSWAMLPLFAASYFSGDQLLEHGSDAPSWARNLHPAAATSTAVLFGANAVTGTWNLWEGRHDPNGRTRRFLHGALFMAASGGFAYAGTRLADEAEQSGAKRRQHRNVNLASMGVSTASWLIMLVGN